MSVDSRRVEKVFSVMQNVAVIGDGLVRAGEIADALCATYSPTSVWQLRADYTALANAGRTTLHAESGAWLVTSKQSAEGAA